MTLAAFSSVLIGSGMEGGLLLVLFALSGAMEDAVTAKGKGGDRQLAQTLSQQSHLRGERRHHS